MIHKNYPTCHSIQDVAEQSANCQGNPLWHIEILASEVMRMQKQITELQAQLKGMKQS